MTQAFNLAQFANFLNSSGQVSSSGLQSGIATQWTTSGSDIYFVNKVSIGASTTPVGTLDVTRSVTNSAIEEIARIRRTGGASSYGTSREGALTFWDENNGTLVGALAGVRQSPSGDYNGGVALYVNNTGAANATSVTQLTKALSLDSNQALRFNSGFGSLGLAYGCRAWVNFNGTGTAAIRASGNVSSLTDNGTGDFTINFSNAMPDANYSWGFGGNNINNDTSNIIQAVITTTGNQTSNSLRITTKYLQGGGAQQSGDHSITNIQIFR